jgi:SAM-dependent methyltransferase
MTEPGSEPLDVHRRLRDFWDLDAETYDRSASHAASDPVEAAAWRSALLRALPPAPARVLDVGAGTGAMTLLAAELGYEVTALDLSPGMLSHARRKAEQMQLEVEFAVGPASEPPDGPFDAVMERHVLWTTPDPVDVLAAWRRSAPAGRLVLFEGQWAATDPVRKARDAAADLLRRLYAVPHDHHADYDPEILARLPLARLGSPAPLLRAVADAGWRAPRIARLTGVEWARRMQSPMGLGWLESRPQYALAADA